MINRRSVALLSLTVLTVFSYQNCAPGFVASGLEVASLSSVNDSDSAGGTSRDDENTEPGSTTGPVSTPAPTGGTGPSGNSEYVETAYDGTAPGNFATTRKRVATSATPVTVVWDLSVDVQTGFKSAGLKLSVQVSSMRASDGSTTVLLVSKPTLITGSKAIDVSDLRIGLNGVRNDVSTTFQGLKGTVPANQQVVLSTSTLIQEISNTSTANDLSLHFRLLYPFGEPLPTTPTATPIPVLSGTQLYATYCASCHGALANSNKRGRTAQQITASFVTAPSMSYLANTLNANDVNAIANALK